MQRSPDIRANIASMLQSAARIAKMFRLGKELEIASCVGNPILQRTAWWIGAPPCFFRVCES